MNCHCSPAQVAGCWARTCWDGAQSGTSKSTTTASASSPPEFEMERYPSRRYLAISAHSFVTGTPEGIRDWLMSLRGDSLVSPSPSPENDPEPMTRVTCGPPPSSAFAWWDRATSSWKTYQVLLLAATLEPFSETWPRAGSLCAGVCYRQRSWERRISEIGSGLLPTPNLPNGGQTARSGDRRDETPGLHGMATTGKLAKWRWPTPTRQNAAYTSRAAKEKYGSGMTLTEAVRVAAGDAASPVVPPARGEVFPSPSARDWRSGSGRQENGHTPQLPEAIGGKLNPTWVEWLMGWPLGWTALEPLGMGRFQQWRQRHGGC